MKPNWRDAPKNCYVDSCESKRIAKGLCEKHYRRFKKYGDPSVVLKELHGMRNMRIYRIWCHMKERCGNHSCSSYNDYGGRGINVCDGWKNSFQVFFDDMGNPPTDRHQIDRIDNNRGYSKKNCRWVLPAENNQNRRSTKVTSLDVQEIKKSTAPSLELAETYGISYSQVRRIKTGKRWTNV